MSTVLILGALVAASGAAFRSALLLRERPYILAFGSSTIVCLLGFVLSVAGVLL